jgi:stage III sporulation protein AH
MVILSAYYLFTDKVDQVPTANDETVSDDIEVNGYELMDPTADTNEVDLDHIESLEHEEHADSDSAEDANVFEQTKTDKQVIDQLEKEVTGNDAITTMQMTRNSDFSQKLEELTAEVSNSEATEEQIEEALNKHDALMDLESKLIAFEEKLLGEYENVAVTYDEARDHYTVNVHAAELERSEAVSIVRAALEDLNIAVHQISVKLFR